jgi:hypothetical protein
MYDPEVKKEFIDTRRHSLSQSLSHTHTFQTSNMNNTYSFYFSNDCYETKFSQHINQNYICDPLITLHYKLTVAATPVTDFTLVIKV